ncbi:MAG: YggS family pyridoxal phosphate-dependent enzyme, partial [Microcystaceae cyanobacterium]
MTLRDRLQSLRATIPTTVRLIAVSKSFPSQQIRFAYNEGLRDFGESRLQEAMLKQQELADLSDLNWHFIGRLQSNKAR